MDLLSDTDLQYNFTYCFYRWVLINWFFFTVNSANNNNSQKFIYSIFYKCHVSQFLMKIFRIWGFLSTFEKKNHILFREKPHLGLGFFNYYHHHYATAKDTSSSQKVLALFFIKYCAIFDVKSWNGFIWSKFLFLFIVIESLGIWWFQWTFTMH